MVEARNLLFQPVSLHLAGDGRGFHIGPRERVRIRDDQVSLEMQMAARRGLIALVPVAEEEPETVAETETEAESPGLEPRPGRGRRGRMRTKPARAGKETMEGD